MIRELSLPMSSAQESNGMEIQTFFFFPLWVPGSGKALQSKLLKYLDSDTLSYYFGCEMTVSLLNASFNSGYFSNVLVEKQSYSPYFHVTPYFTALKRISHD